MEKQMDKERVDRLNRLYSAFEIVAEGSYVYLCDMKYDYSRWSEEAVQYFGLPGIYMYQAGDIWEEHIHPDDKESYHESIHAIFSGTDGGHDMQYRAKDRQGRYVVCTCHGMVLRDQDNNPEYFVGAIRNHGEINSVDSLTGFQNQFGLFEHLNVLYGKEEKANIMMLGIGHFATINQMWGYDFGNVVIHKLVQILKEEFRNEGAIYRVGGVKFVLLTRTLSLEELSERYRKIKKMVSEDLEIDGCHPYLQIYGSAMEVQNFNVNPQAMYSCLEYAYNLSKEQGSGDFRIFNNQIDASRDGLLTLINVIRKSVEDNCSGFFLYYQPIVEAGTHRLSGAEALLRWGNPEYGMVPPGKFIPIIENDPIFIQLGEWLLRRAMEETKPLLKEYPDLELNINVSYSQLREDSFASMVKKALNDTGYPPKNLCLEITERCRLIDINRLTGIIAELHAVGVRFALDDFGTGYSSVDILNLLDCDVVKIDKVFIDHVTEELKSSRLLTVMCNFAEVCESRVCAEGVETKEQCEMVEQCGAQSIQGYYFSKPLPFDALCEWAHNPENNK